MTALVREAPGVTVTTAGTVRDPVAVSVTRKMPSLGPGTLGPDSSALAGTATVDLADPGGIVRDDAGRPSPWAAASGYPPANGDAALVTIAGEVRLTGEVEESSGSALGLTRVHLVDGMDRLRHRVSFEPLADTMWPVYTTSLATGAVNPMLRHEHYVSAAMRAAGYFHMPKPSAACLLHLPMSGSILPEGGTAELFDTGTSTARWSGMPWGLAIRNLTARYRFGGTAGTGGPGANRWDLTVYVARYGTGSSTIEFRNNVGSTSGVLGWVEISFPSTTTMRIRGSGTSATSSTHFDVTVPYDDAQPFFRITRNPATETSSIWHKGVPVWTGYIPDSPTWAMTDVSITSTSSGVYLGSIYLTGGGAGTEPLSVNASLRPSASLGNANFGPMRAGPYIESVEVLDLLLDIAEATASNVWLDGEGRLHWAGPGVLEAQAVSATLTADADLLDLAWRHSSEDVKRRVSVTSRQPSVSTSRNGSTLLWSGMAMELENGDVESVWMTAPADQDWLRPKDPVRVTSGTAVVPLGQSTIGGVRESDTAESWATSTYLTTTWERINSQTFVVDHTAKSLTTGWRLVLRGLASASTIPSTLSRAGLPRLVGYGRVDWKQRTYMATAAVGPETAPDYEHDVKHWLQSADSQSFANWLAVALVNGKPVLDRVPLAYRADLELGQVVNIDDPHVYRRRMKCLVVGLEERHDASGSDLWATFRVLSTTAL